jgi:MoaA/NifB/PqqE/SkfB family radical SAM enzyme
MNSSRKAFRVLVTERCNMRCPTCFNKNIRNECEMEVNNFTNVCQWLTMQGNIKRIKLMGGEPTVHSDFSNIMSIATEYFPCVYLFTNAVNDRINHVILRKNDAVVYNISCLPTSISSNKLLPELDCAHIFEIRVDTNTETDRICKKIRHIYECLNNRMIVNLTLNCVENIFKFRDIIIKKWNIISMLCRDELGIMLNLDHDAPYCFTEETNMILSRYNPMCTLECAGLITADMHLRFCNQTSENIISLITDSGLITYDEASDQLKKHFERKLNSNKNNFCKECSYFATSCNGSCFAHRF